MSSGIFRGKESSNRIELSRLVQDLLNFSVSGSLWLWGGWVDGGGGWLMGVFHTCAHACTCTHRHTRTCTCGKHDNFMQMAAPLGNPWEFPMMSYAHACACMCMCTCVGYPLTPQTHIPPSPHPPPPRGDPRNQSKFNST